MHQRTYTKLAHGYSQKSRLYLHLHRNLGRWIPTPELAKAATAGTGIGMSPRSRITDLRQQLKRMELKLRIEHRTQRVGNELHGYYRMVRITNPLM
jgi:hypothetical protein